MRILRIATPVLLLFGGAIAAPPVAAEEGGSCLCPTSVLPRLSSTPLVPGASFTILIEGEAGARFALVESRRPGPSPSPLGTLCVSTDADSGFRVLVDSLQGSRRPRLRLDEHGCFTASIDVPARPGLLGRRRYLQAAVQVPGGRRLTNGLTLIVGEEGKHQTVASLCEPRTNAAAGLLPDGRLLITGGGLADAIRFAIDATPTAEIYDPLCKGVRFTDPMADPRGLHTVTPLGNGRVLVCGGVSQEFEVLRSAEEYDPVTGTFSAVGSMLTPRYGHTATLLADGTVLLVGGSTSIDDLGSAFANSLATAEIYDPVLQSFSLVPSPLNEARSGHVSVALDDGRVLVVGGARDVTRFGGPDLAPAGEVFDPGSRAFEPVGAHLVPRTIHAAVKLLSGEVLVVGGLTATLSVADRCEIFDPGTGEFRETGRLPVGKALPRLARLQDGRVLETGGLASFATARGLIDASLYDPATGTFTPTGSLVGGRAGHLMQLLDDGTVVSVGGATDTATDEPSIELYVPE